MKLIQTKDYLLLIDEEAEIKKYYSYYLKDNKNIIKYMGDTNEPLKENEKGIIAYRKLNKEAKELDLPELPNPFEDNFNDLEWNDIADEDWKSRGGEGNRSHFMYRQGYIHGAYKALQTQSKQFSLDDIEYAITQAFLKGIDRVEFNETIKEEIIQSLSTQLPKEFIPEYEYKCSCYGYGSIGCNYENNINNPVKRQDKCEKETSLKTIKNSKGKEELVGTYKY